LIVVKEGYFLPLSFTVVFGCDLPYDVLP